MPVYPKAKYRPLPQFSNGKTYPNVGVAFHVNDSGSVNSAPTSLYNWIAGNNGMSCHFQLMSDGTFEQYLDTDLGSWCQVNGNDTHISVETQGLASEPMNAKMVQAFGELMAWINKTHGIPLVAVDNVNIRGLVGHGAGGAAWGGHYACPGVRLTQRETILAIARPAPTPTPTPPSPTIGADMFELVHQVGQNKVYAVFADRPCKWVPIPRYAITLAHSPLNIRQVKAGEPYGASVRTVTSEELALTLSFFGEEK